MHYTCVWHTKSICPSKFQVNTVTNIEVIRLNVICHARVIVIGVSSDLQTYLVPDRKPQILRDRLVQVLLVRKLQFSRGRLV